MIKNKNLLLLTIALMSYSSSVLASNTLEISPIAEMTNVQQLAGVQFLPNMEDSELGLGNRGGIGSDHNIGVNCNEYPFKASNCKIPKDLFDACPFDPKKFKVCKCHTGKFIFNSTTCVYTAESPFTPNPDRLLQGDFCQDEATTPKLSTACGCKFFRYTNTASCANSERIIDTRSSCRENNEPVRYEFCKCDPAQYPYLFKGDIKSEAFLNDVASHCGNKLNFKICKNEGGETAYKCAVDPGYKYDPESCKIATPAGSDSHTPQGSSQTFVNGYGNSVTLYSVCDCPSTYSASCNGYKGSSFYMSDGGNLECRKKIAKCKLGFFKSMTDKGTANCNESVHGSVIEVSSICKKRNGVSVYRCKCRYRGGDWDYHGKFCGTCANKTSHIYCVENGNSISNSCVN